jgi:chemotaxis protein MotB
MSVRNLCGCGGVLLAVMMLAGGCEDPEKQQLRKDRDILQAELDSARSATEAAEARAQELDQNRADLEEQLAALQSRMASQREGAPGEFVSLGPGVDRAVLPGSILFDLGNDALKPDSKSTLNQMINRLKTDFADREVFVIGHTDTTPIVKQATKQKHPTNWHLSTDRAVAVAQYLISQGISPKRVVCAGCGEYRPRASNADNQGKAQNRRVEVYAVSRSASATP